jgi:hypothetical protein
MRFEYKLLVRLGGVGQLDRRVPQWRTLGLS